MAFLVLIEAGNMTLDINALNRALQQATGLARTGDFDGAIASVRATLFHAPDDPMLSALLGNLLFHGKGDAAGASAALAIAIKGLPQHAGFRIDYANTLFATACYPEAATHFREAIHLDPRLWQAHIGLATTLITSGDPELALASANQAAALNPRLPDARDIASRSLLLLGRTSEAIDAARQGLAINPGDRRLRCSLAVALTYSDSHDPAEVARAYTDAGRALAAEFPELPAKWPNQQDASRPLRIAYLSPDLREHSVAYFLEPMLQHHDRDAFEIYLYSTGGTRDAVTDRLQSLADHFIDAAALPTDALVNRIRADQIDILIDLAGHSGNNRLSVLARRAAPVQATYLGWPTTTGLPTVDWRIADAITDPAGTEAHNAERLSRIPAPFLTYAGPGLEIEVPPPAPARPIRFGSFNALMKLSPTCIDVWSSVLREVPESQLILKSLGLERPPTRARILSQFAAHGIGPERIHPHPRTATTREHLEAYSQVDIALDTFPYNGTTTTCEALWMGVPVITLEGRAHAARVGKTILTALGFSQWCARDAADLSRIAASLARDRAALASLRQTLRSGLRSSSLCDHAAFTRALESSYRTMWQDFCLKSK